MGLPKFDIYAAGSPYIWEEYPSLPSDRADLLYPPHKIHITIAHARLGIVFARKHIAEKFKLDLFFKNISLSMANSLADFFDEAFFRFYPDSATGDYYTVYLGQDEVNPILQRGGTYNFGFTLMQK